MPLPLNNQERRTVTKLLHGAKLYGMRQQARGMVGQLPQVKIVNECSYKLQLETTEEITENTDSGASTLGSVV